MSQQQINNTNSAMAYFQPIGYKLEHVGNDGAYFMATNGARMLIAYNGFITNWQPN